MLSHANIQLESGDRLLRRDLQASLGGQPQSGISPSRTAPYVLLFSDPSSGEQHGYFDGWHEDGYFHYAGEGQAGDQQMQRGNKALRSHEADGRGLHLFTGSGKGQPVTYVDRFEYVDHYETDAPDTAGYLRRVFMFRLRPVGGATHVGDPAPSFSDPPPSDQTDEVAVETHNTERYITNPSAEPTPAEKREAQLVKEFVAWSRAQGVTCSRKRIRPEGEASPLFCDIYRADTNQLIEAKGSVTREAVRMAIGQLLDYRRFITPAPDLAVLLPERPRVDLGRLLHRVSVDLIYPSPTVGFVIERASAA